MRTITDVENWINKQFKEGYAVPVIINGGEFAWMQPTMFGFTLQDKENYNDEIDILKEGEEFPRFRQCMTDDELDGVTFIAIRHKSQGENHDIEIGVWDVDFDDDEDEDDEWAGKHEISDVSLWIDNRTDNLTYHANGKEITVSGEFYIDNDNWLHHSHIFEDGTEVEFRVKRYNNSEEFEIL